MPESGQRAADCPSGQRTASENKTKNKESLEEQVLTGNDLWRGAAKVYLRRPRAKRPELDSLEKKGGKGP